MKTKPLVDALESASNSIQATINGIQSLATELQVQERKNHQLKADNNMLMGLVLEYGGHKADCTYIEECESGRILKDQEHDLCNCGWSETVLMIQSRTS